MYILLRANFVLQVDGPGFVLKRTVLIPFRKPAHLCPFLCGRQGDCWAIVSSPPCMRQSFPWGQRRPRGPWNFPYRLPLSLFVAFTSRAQESVPAFSVTSGSVFLSRWVPNILALPFERLPSSGLYCVFVAFWAAALVTQVPGHAGSLPIPGFPKLGAALAFLPQFSPRPPHSLALMAASDGR